MAEQMTASRGVRIDADRSVRWRYGFVMTPMASAAMAFLLGLGAIGGVIAASSFIPVWILATCLNGAYSFAFCVGWLGTTSRTSYEIRGGVFTAYRGSRVIRSFPVATVVQVRMIGRMDARRCLTDPTPPPNWPRAVLFVLDGSTTTRVLLPEIMLWGQEPVAAAEAKLDEALRAMKTRRS